MACEPLAYQWGLGVERGARFLRTLPGTAPPMICVFGICRAHGVS